MIILTACAVYILVNFGLVFPLSLIVTVLSIITYFRNKKILGTRSISLLMPIIMMILTFAFLVMDLSLMEKINNPQSGIERRMPETQKPGEKITASRVIHVFVDSNDCIELRSDDETKTIAWDGSKSTRTMLEEYLHDNMTLRTTIELKTERGTSYATYKNVCDVIKKSVHPVRDEYSISQYGLPFDELDIERQREVKIQFPGIVELP